MTRMSREFSLVLLGAGILSAGYFMSSSPDLEAKADEQGAERVGAGEHDSTGRYRPRPGFVMLMAHSPAYSGGGTRSPAMGGVARGGFGGIAKATGVGG